MEVSSDGCGVCGAAGTWCVQERESTCVLPTLRGGEAQEMDEIER